MKIQERMHMNLSPMAKTRPIDANMTYVWSVALTQVRDEVDRRHRRGQDHRRVDHAR